MRILSLTGQIVTFLRLSEIKLGILLSTASFHDSFLIMSPSPRKSDHISIEHCRSGSRPAAARLLMMFGITAQHKRERVYIQCTVYR